MTGCRQHIGTLITVRRLGVPPPPHASRNRQGFGDAQRAWPPGIGASPKRLDKLICQSATTFIFPYTRYFYNEMLKLRFIIIVKIIFPYTNYPAA